MQLGLEAPYELGESFSWRWIRSQQASYRQRATEASTRNLEWLAACLDSRRISCPVSLFAAVGCQVKSKRGIRNNMAYTTSARYYICSAMITCSLPIQRLSRKVCGSSIVFLFSILASPPAPSSLSSRFNLLDIIAYLDQASLSLGRMESKSMAYLPLYFLTLGKGSTETGTLRITIPRYRTINITYTISYPTITTL